MMKKCLLCSFILIAFASPVFALDEAAKPSAQINLKNQIELSTTHDFLTDNNDNWQSYQLFAQHQFAPRTLLYGELKHTKRFSRRDENMMLGGYYPLTEKLTINGELNISPTNQVLPNHTELVSLAYVLGSGWVASGGIKHSKYQSVSLNQIPLSLEYYFGNFRVGYSPTLTHVFGSTLVNHRLVGSYYYNDASYLTVGVSEGKEADQINDRFLKYNVTSFGVYGRHWFNQDWALAWDLNQTQQGKLFNRTEVALGIRRAF